MEVVRLWRGLPVLPVRCNWPLTPSPAPDQNNELYEHDHGASDVPDSVSFAPTAWRLQMVFHEQAED
jgi:hypothetical protein